MLTVLDMRSSFLAPLVECLVAMTKEADCGGWRVDYRYAQNTLGDVVGFGPGEKRVADPELPREVDGPHLAAADRPRRRHLEPIIAVFPLLGH